MRFHLLQSGSGFAINGVVPLLVILVENELDRCIIPFATQEVRVGEDLSPVPEPFEKLLALTLIDRLEPSTLGLSFDSKEDIHIKCALGSDLKLD